MAVYFKEGNALTTTTESSLTESITHAETSNDIIFFIKQRANKYNLEYSKPDQYIHKETPSLRDDKPDTTSESPNNERELNVQPEVREYYGKPITNGNIKFTSGHSMLFGISIEDAANMKSTTQNSLYNTRVSPTLPTWRDRDEATTKKYPVNSHYDGKSKLITNQKAPFGCLLMDILFNIKGKVSFLLCFYVCCSFLVA